MALKKWKPSELFRWKKKGRAIRSRVAVLLLKKEIIERQVRLVCPHEHTIEFDGAGRRMSGFADEDEPTPAKRLCMICGTSERGDEVTEAIRTGSAFEHYSSGGGWHFRQLLAKPRCRVSGSAVNFEGEVIPEASSLEEVEKYMTEQNRCYKWLSNIELKHAVAKASEKAQEESLKTYKKVLDEELKRGKK